MDILVNLQFHELSIIGQSSNRQVIFCFHKSKRRIICFDQHAVDERIRYEFLLDRADFIEDLDAMKSRACHGAIRFGDKLTLNQSRDLIEKLLRCKVPFRCAHSRCNVSVLGSLDEIIHLDMLRRLLNTSTKSDRDNEHIESINR